MGGLQQQGLVHQRRSPAKAEHTVVEHREMFDGCQEENWAGRSQLFARRCYRAQPVAARWLFCDASSGQRLDASVAHPPPAIRASILSEASLATYGRDAALKRASGTEEGEILGPGV